MSLVAKDGTNNNRIALSNTAFILYHKQHILQLLYIKSNNDVKSSRYFIPFTQHQFTLVTPTTFNCSNLFFIFSKGYWY